MKMNAIFALLLSTLFMSSGVARETVFTSQVQSEIRPVGVSGMS